MRRRRLPAAPLLDALDARGVVIPVEASADRRAYYRAHLSGYVCDAIADRIAIRWLGLPYELIYGPEVLRPTT